MSKEVYQNKYRIPSVRAAWHNYSDGMYFVTICTEGRKHYFGEITNNEGRQQMNLSPIGKFTDEQFQNVQKHYPYAEIPLWVVMPNHIHSIITIHHDKIPYERRNIVGTRCDDDFTGTRRDDNFAGTRRGDFVETRCDDDFTGTRRDDNFAGTRRGDDFAGTRRGDDFAGTRRGDDFAGTRRGDDFAGARRDDNFAGTRRSDFAGTRRDDNFAGTRRGDDFTGTRCDDDFTGTRRDDDFTGTRRGDFVETRCTTSLQNDTTHAANPQQQIANMQGWLSVVVGGLKRSVTHFANQCHIPFAWQTRFHDHIIRNKNEMNRIAKYIENNVANWKQDTFHSEQET